MTRSMRAADGVRFDGLPSAMPPAAPRGEPAGDTVRKANE